MDFSLLWEPFVCGLADICKKKRGTDRQNSRRVSCLSKKSRLAVASTSLSLGVVRVPIARCPYLSKGSAKIRRFPDMEAKKRPQLTKLGSETVETDA